MWQIYFTPADKYDPRVTLRSYVVTSDLLTETTLTSAPNLTQAKIADHQPVQASSPELLAAPLQKILLRVDTVCTITGLSVPTIYRLMSQGLFPRPLKITSHARAWRLSDINAWIDSRVQAISVL
jgi:prophage regulatory protein